ncbi:hypothetical protein [Vibrio splendidus]|uniref:hypothetical protein n=1 Tax=Vibrio splendidus TaxID=29497 RepID=UPI000C81EF4F|nr:hypothetical protein [Vibrio splendidus]PMO52550.1 hypothetical protein BCT08_21405 [Vibrio splendidus]
MKQHQTLSANGSVRFNAGQAGKYLIIREASNTLMLRGDALRPVEIERGDTVDITQFDELELMNLHSTFVTVEYQISDIPIVTRAQKVSVDNQIVVSEISRPLTIESMPEVTLQGTSKVSVVSMPAIETTTEKINLSGLPDKSMTGSVISIDANEKRTAVMLQAGIDNVEPVIVQGCLRLYAGGMLTIPSTLAVTMTGASGDVVYCGEVL